jgi:hypothetical protein
MTPIRSYFASVLLWLFLPCAFASASPADSVSQIIKAEAQAMSDYLIVGDFKSFAKYTYPKVMRMMGGEDSMVHILQKNQQAMKDDGVYFLSISIGEPSPIMQYRGEWQCTVPETIAMKVKGGRVTSFSSLIAISMDRGVTWFFLDSSNKDIKTLKKKLPNLNIKLQIPPQPQAIFTKD